MAKANAQTQQTKAAVTGSLPPGWRMVRFDEIAQSIGERVKPGDADTEFYVGLEHLDTDSLKIRRWGTPEDVEATKLRFRAGDIIFGKRRVYQRKLAVAEFDGICSAHAMVIRAREEAVEKDFLPFFMQSDMFMERALAISVGSLSPTINWSALRRQEFPLPPKDEQRHIAEILWAADQIVEAHRQVQSNLGGLVASMLREFLGREWVLRPCEVLFARPPRNGISPVASEEGKGYPTLSIGAVRDGAVVAAGNIKYAELTEGQLEQFRLCRGDLLVVRGNGNRELCGKCGAVGDIPENCFYPDLLIRVVFNPGIILPSFACLQWNAPNVHRRLLTRAKSTNGIWKINGQDLRNHMLKVPPLSEQQAFMCRVAKPQMALAAVSDAISASRQMKSTLLNHLLSGASHVQ